MTYRAISADSHIVEPPHLWEKWLPPELRKFAPKLVKDHEGGDAWQYGENMAPAPIGLVAVRRGRKYTDPDYKWTGLRIDQVNQGAFYGEPRLAEQDEDGVSAEVIYAPVRAAMHFMSRATTRSRSPESRPTTTGCTRNSARSLRSAWSVSR